MKAYTGLFVKADGSRRQMRFAKLEDLPPAFLDAKTTGTGQSPQQAPGKELVWDLDAGQFRVFNYNTVQGVVSASEFDENNLV
jgi:hypothetical protein